MITFLSDLDGVGQFRVATSHTLWFLAAVGYQVIAKKFSASDVYLYPRGGEELSE